MSKVLVPLAQGVEEMEAVIIIDTLRRAGWDVTSAGLAPGEVTASRGVKLVPDAVLDELDTDAFDVIVLPGGGPGAENLKNSEKVITILQNFFRQGKWVAAICAAPTVLDKAGILEGKKVTCYPAMKDDLQSGTFTWERVTVDGKLITSQGPATALDFALTLIAKIDGPEKANEVSGPMLVR